MAAADGCAIVNCEEPRAHAQWCDDHARRIVDDPLWVPGRVEGDEIVCGWCGTRIWTLENVEHVIRRRFILERDPASDGKCLPTAGGFRILKGPELQSYLRSGDTPLYRSHGPRCARRSEWAAWLARRLEPAPA